MRRVTLFPRRRFLVLSRMALFPHIALFALVATLASVRASGADEAAGDAKEGRDVYDRYCVSCHGERGDGHGEAPAYEDPRPRDYRPGIFKCRSTPTGSLPLVSDLERTL